ncbi:MAG TPA: LamB/YcsF family protein, partial [Candidatus Avacidaminococcus intestinavium]|nr:LamB/YcsF family protein [Candidatus Avacidaminococcus intestinavium]
VDLNSDLGESFGLYQMGNDAAILQKVSSANIACGFHAGDPNVMRKTVQLALTNDCAIGAHPGLPDLVGFGRRKMAITPDEAYNMVLYQVGALAAFVKAEGGRLQHVKPHGALYNLSAVDSALAEAIASAVYKFDATLVLMGLAGSESITAAQRIGLKTASEVFADRTYQDDGSLTPRSRADAMIANEEAAIQQVLQMVTAGTVKTVSGKVIPVAAESVCIHGDGVKALLFAEKIRQALEQSGIKITGFN